LGIGSFRPEDAILVLGRCALTGKNQGRQRRLDSILHFFFRTGEEKTRTAHTRIGINT
jgi:hypothetical protein